MIFRPTAEWAALRAADPAWSSSLLRYALPLALVPAVGWPAGQMLGDSPPPGWGATPERFASVFITTLAFSLVGVVLLALAFYVLAPVFHVHRNWNRSMTVAAYASTPVFVASPLLVSPALAVGSIVALFHCFALCYLGLQQILECRESESAVYVAAAVAVTGFASMLMGGLCGAAGVL